MGEQIASPLTYTQVHRLFEPFANIRCLSQNMQSAIKKTNHDKINRRDMVKINTFLIQNQFYGGNKLGYWENRWATGQSQWHKNEVNPLFLKWFDECKGRRARGTMETDMRFLFPLCGKSRDLIWVYRKGYYVTGIEAVASVVDALYTEANIPYTKYYEKEIDGWIYESSGDNAKLKVFCCDVFKMSMRLLRYPVDRVYDIKSYVAIEREDREKYIRIILSMVTSKFRYLLIAVQYDPTRFAGPPRHVDRAELTNLFKNSKNTNVPGVTVNLLQETKREPAPMFNLDWMNNAVYLIRN